MPITNHVTSLELSRRLKELGVPQISIFARALDTGQVVGFPTKLAELGMYDEKYKWCSAYLVSELGEMLPKYHYSIHTSFYNKQWRVTSSPIQRGIGAAVCPPLYTQNAETEANARAKMLIYLIENHLISVEELGN